MINWPLHLGTLTITTNYRVRYSTNIPPCCSSPKYGPYPESTVNTMRLLTPTRPLSRIVPYWAMHTSCHHAYIITNITSLTSADLLLLLLLIRFHCHCIFGSSLLSWNFPSTAATLGSPVPLLLCVLIVTSASGWASLLLFLLLISDF